MATDKLVDFDHVTDYISREAAIERFCDVYCGCTPEECGFKIPQDGAEECAAVRALKDVPASDVRTVVRGKWEPGETIFFCGEEHIAPRTCSVCGRSALDEPWYFCPNCGADMREVDSDG